MINTADPLPEPLGIKRFNAPRAYIEGAHVRALGYPLKTGDYKDNPELRQQYEQGWNDEDNERKPLWTNLEALRKLHEEQLEARRKAHKAKRAGFDTVIDELFPGGLTTRAYNCLLVNDITTVAKIRQLTLDYLRRMPNCGQRTVMEIWNALHPDAPISRALDRPTFNSIEAAIQYLQAHRSLSRIEIVVQQPPAAESAEQQIAHAVRKRLNLPIQDAPNESGCTQPRIPPRPFKPR